MKAITTFILFVLFCVENLFSQPTYCFKHYNINSGLSQNTVTSLFQDSKGFIWIGTKNGLNRFDGYEFKIFQRNDSADGLSNSMIYHITEDKQQTIWISTDKGISLYNPLTETFLNFTAQTEEGTAIDECVYKIIADNFNRIWIQTSLGVYIYYKDSDKLQCINNKFSEKTPVIPCALHLDQDGIAYIATPRIGIYSYDIKTDQVKQLCRYENTPLVIHDYKDGELLVGTLSRGLWILDKTTGQMNKIPVDDSINSNIYVRDIKKISENEYWIATENGIYILTDKDIHHLIHEEFNLNSLSDNTIYALLKDKDGGIWAGSYFEGINYITASNFKTFHPIAYKNSLNGFRVSGFVCDKNNNLWIATEDKGLNYFDSHTKKFSHITPDSSPLKINFTNIQCINLNDDELWIGTFTKGIDVLNLKTKQCRHYEKTNKQYALTTNEVFSIYTDSRDTTWIGVSDGLFIYNPVIDGFKKFDKIPNIHISDIEEDKNGDIWFASYSQGVFRYNPATGIAKNYRYDKNNPNSLCFDRITDIFLDSKQQLWFSSEDGGFCLFKSTEENFIRITVKDGLPGNVIYKILEDDNQHLWLSTSNGLAKFNPQTMKVEHLYNLSDGLRTKQFNYNSGIKASDGTLYFGSIDGFVAFNPSSFHSNDFQYNVVLTGFYIHNQKSPIESRNKILTKAISYEDNIYLNHDQSTFSLSFSALNYSKRENEAYAYQLEGIDKNWTYTNHTNRVSYNSIPPGNYKFHVKYSKDGQNWDSQETCINIHIVPPFWQTKGAYAFYILLIIGILFTFIYLYIRKKKRQIREHLAQQEQLKREEIYQAKINFFTNVAHEIRTPLTLIKTPLDYIIHNSPSKQEIEENLIIMERNIERLLELVNQLLDFRKIESKSFALSPELTNISKLVSDTYKRFVPAAKQRNLTIALSSPAQTITAFIDKEAITKVCSNLFNNAVKYADTYIKIELSESKDQKQFQIAVHNDGTPIPIEMRQSIFEAFFRLKNNQKGNQLGSGIGLTLASSLVHLHNGMLYLDDQANDTLFVARIPKNISTDIKETSNLPPIQCEMPELAVNGQEPSSSMILIVEDNDELRMLLANHLGKYYRVMTASNGMEAMEILKHEIVNLIISDVMMPQMGGIELCRHVKESLDTCHILFILLTAKTTLENHISGLESGADAYIDKPFSMPHLLAQINTLLENRAKLLRNLASKPYIATDNTVQNKADEIFLNQLTQIIRQNIENDMFNIDNLAMEMNMSRTSLHRKIKGLTGLTPGDLIRTIRLQKAAELLSEGKLRINEICIQVGIHSLSYFSKSFKEQFGVLPKDFVKSQSPQS